MMDCRQPTRREIHTPTHMLAESLDPGKAKTPRGREMDLTKWHDKEYYPIEVRDVARTVT